MHNLPENVIPERQGVLRIKGVQYQHMYAIPVPTVNDVGQMGYDFRLVGFEEKWEREVQERICLANICNKMIWDDTIILTVQDWYETGKVDPETGEPEIRHLSEEATDALLRWAALQLKRVPLFTQSSVKSGTYYMVIPEVARKLKEGLALDPKVDGAKFCAYVGLIFSELTGEAYIVRPEYGEDEEGTDGNSIGPKSVYGQLPFQFRALHLDSEGWPKAIAKGTIVPVQDQDTTVLHRSQVKIGFDSKPGWMVVAKTPVSGKWAYSFSSMEVWWLTRWFSHNSKKGQQMRQYIEHNVRREVRKLLTLLEEENRVALLRRFGALELDIDGEFKDADRAVLSALRSNFPYCQELFDRLGRLFVRHLVRKIAPSCGVYGKRYLVRQTTRARTRALGQREWKKAKYLAVRLPNNGFWQILFFERDTHGVIHPDDAAQMTADSDGDYIIYIPLPKEIEATDFTQWFHRFEMGKKAADQRREGPINYKFVLSQANAARNDAKWIGILTDVEMKYILASDLEGAAEAGKAAMDAPKLLKWEVFGPAGSTFREWAESLVEDSEDLPLPAWRKMQREAMATVKSPYDLADPKWEVDVRCALDYAWNVMIDEVTEWALAHPLADLDLPELGENAFEIHPDLEESLKNNGEAKKWRLSLVRFWGSYWKRNIGKGGNHKTFYTSLRNKVQADCNLARAVWTLLWQPKPREDGTVSDGFAFKWRVMSYWKPDNGLSSWEYVLGRHPDVQAELLKRRKKRDEQGKRLVARMVVKTE